MAEKNYERMSREELQAERERLQAEYEAFRARGLKLDLSRGKPSNRQLDMMTGMLDCLHTTADCKSVGGFDCRNYGVLNGTPEAKKLFSDLLGIPEKNLFIGGNSSLNLMYDAVARACCTAPATANRGCATPAELNFSARCRAMTGISASASRWASP